jgi:hypothetical protein
MSALGIDPIIRDILGFPNYQISENGEIYNKTTGKELKPWLDSKTGYYRIDLVEKIGVKKHLYIHRLLAAVFIDNPLNKKEVDHINKIRTDNRLENLRWSTHSENNTNTNRNIKGIIKITPKKSGQRWMARITKDNKTYTKCFLYNDEGLQEAIKWRQEKQKELHIFT